MSVVSESDRKLIAELESLLDQLASTRRSLYTSRPGCSCNEKHLCALHAAVHNHLSEAADDLARAIAYAQSEG